MVANKTEIQRQAAKKRKWFLEQNIEKNIIESVFKLYHDYKYIVSNYEAILISLFTIHLLK